MRKIKGIILFIIFLLILFFCAIFTFDNKFPDENTIDGNKPCIINTIHLKELTFDRDKMINAYKKSFEYCEDFPLEGTGSLYICQQSYFAEKHEKLNNAYLQIENVCRDTVAQYARDKCMFAVLNSLKNNENYVILDSEICFER